MTQVKYHENKVKTRENKCKYMKTHMKTQSIARGHISDEKRPKTAGRGRRKRWYLIANLIFIKTWKYVKALENTHENTW